MGKIKTLMQKQIGDTVSIKHLNQKHLPDFGDCKKPEYGVLTQDVSGVGLSFFAVRPNGRTKLFYETPSPNKDQWVVRHS